jgi:hypothetical protein
MNQKRKSTPYFSIKWNLVKNVFKPTAKFEILFKYITRVMKCLKGFENKAKQLHFIAPILVCVCSQFDDTEICVKEDLDGVTLRAHGHFESCQTNKP